MQTFKVTQSTGFTLRTIYIQAPSLASATATAWAMNYEVVSVEAI